MADESKDPKLRLDQEQYGLLLKCSKIKNIEEWNRYRDEHPKDEVWLEGADLERTFLANAKLEDANLLKANLESANFLGAKLQHADLFGANLENATLRNAKLQNADLRFAKLENASLYAVNLEDADVSYASVNGRTFIVDCWVNRQTDFTGVALANARVEPGLRQLLEYNVRRLGWLRWYREGPRWRRVLKWMFVWPFWAMSDWKNGKNRDVPYLSYPICLEWIECLTQPQDDEIVSRLRLCTSRGRPRGNDHFPAAARQTQATHDSHK